ncbi:MAG: flagellar protein FlgN [Sedimenticola sp.]
MAITTTQINHLLRLLSMELQCTENLSTVLKQEHLALTESDPDQIIAISERKKVLIEQMGRHLADRQGFLASLGLNSDRKSVDTLLGSLPEAEAAYAVWRQLMEMAAQLNKSNQINGGIITLGSRHIRQTIDILTGNQSAGDTYNPKGRQSDTTSRSLARA